MLPSQTPDVRVDELESLIKAVEPNCFLIPARVLRRVIKQHYQIGGLGLLVPHRKGLCLKGTDLVRFVTNDEIGLPPNALIPPEVVLIAQPTSLRLARQGRETVLAKHWRLLFHLEIDQIMQRRLATGLLTRTEVRRRIRRIGLTAYSEIKEVLRQEGYLLPPETPESVYAEFVAVYLTLRHFDPARLPHFFPALSDWAKVDAMVAEDVDAEAIYNGTRLAGATDGTTPQIQAPASGTVFTDPPPSHSEAELNLLCENLRRALSLSEEDTDICWRALAPVVARAADETWSQEARFLADLRNVCQDSNDVIHSVDLMGWALSLGELPIKRQLPGHQDVTVLRHLRQASKRLVLLEVSEDDRQRWTRLLARAVAHREHALRERFRPLLTSALEEVGLRPQNVAEEIGRARLVEELLDRVVEVGHFNIGNLRDAVSRNQMKLPDLKNPLELLRGDPLIRLNRRLAVDLDGIYRRGEFYMRLLHRLSSVAFGTTVGRLAVLFLILPFGLAFFVMITPDIAMEEGEKLVKFLAPYFGGMGVEEQPIQKGHHPTHAFPLPNPWGVAGFGVCFLLLFNFAGFRSRFLYGVGQMGRGLQRIHTDALGLIHLPAVQAILHNHYWRLFRRFVLWPSLMATNGGLFAWWLELETPTIGLVAGVCLVLGMVLFNTRGGRDLEEGVTDWLLGYWAWLSVDFLPGVIRLIMDLSRRCLNAVEQMFYAVNERLRFRGADNLIVVTGKAILGLVWGCLAYVLRFAINLLIEPQINPIKHFPVVTVSHKVCLPMIPTLASLLRNTGAVSRPTTTATGIVFGIPGIFGFMVWELKENWKLYASNRSANLNRVMIGSHGETMYRLLHPGFHSGTIPKLFKRLRRAERHDQQPSIRKILAELHHVETGIAHFVERELLALLRRSKTWGGITVGIASIHLATNRILVELHCPTLETVGDGRFVVGFDRLGGWLVASVVQPGWLSRLNSGQIQTLASALEGLYQMAGVHLTGEQICASLPPTIVAVEITDLGLVVWTGEEDRQDVVYDLGARAAIPPVSLHGELREGMPILDPTRLLLANTPLAWQDWVRVCAGDYTREPTVAVLPFPNPSAATTEQGC